MDLNGLTNRQIGKACQIYRISKRLRQSDVATDLHYSVNNVSQFECGRSNSLRVFLWYLQAGLTVDKLIELGRSVV